MRFSVHAASDEARSRRLHEPSPAFLRRPSYVGYRNLRQVIQAKVQLTARAHYSNPSIRRRVAPFAQGQGGRREMGAGRGTHPKEPTGSTNRPDTLPQPCSPSPRSVTCNIGADHTYISQDTFGGPDFLRGNPLTSWMRQNRRLPESRVRKSRHLDCSSSDTFLTPRLERLRQTTARSEDLPLGTVRVVRPPGRRLPEAGHAEFRPARSDKSGSQ